MKKKSQDGYDRPRLSSTAWGWELVVGVLPFCSVRRTRKDEIKRVKTTRVVGRFYSCQIIGFNISKCLLERKVQFKNDVSAS